MFWLLERRHSTFSNRQYAKDHGKQEQTNTIPGNFSISYIIYKLRTKSCYVYIQEVIIYVIIICTYVKLDLSKKGLLII